MFVRLITPFHTFRIYYNTLRITRESGRKIRFGKHWCENAEDANTRAKSGKRSRMESTRRRNRRGLFRPHVENQTNELSAIRNAVPLRVRKEGDFYVAIPFSSMLHYRAAVLSED